jgi:hypothetical protein
MNHHLDVDFRGGLFFAECSCGRWALSRGASVSATPSEVYDQIERAFCEHLSEAIELSHDEEKSPTNLHRTHNGFEKVSGEISLAHF